MKTLIFALAMIGSTQAFAVGQTVLRCNISGGDLQEVQIVSQNDQLILKELDTSGSRHERVLAAEELSGGKINLYTRDVGTKGTLTKTRGGWAFEFVSSWSRDIGMADCY